MDPCRRRDLLILLKEKLMTPESAPVREILDPHVGWAIFCLVLALIAMIFAIALGLAERPRDD